MTGEPIRIRSPWRGLRDGLLLGGLALNVVVLSWLGCSPKSRRVPSSGLPAAAAVNSPVETATAEPDPALLADFSEAPPANPFLDEVAVVAIREPTEPSAVGDLGLPPTPPTFAGAPQLPVEGGVTVAAAEAEAAIGDATRAAAAGAATKNPLAGAELVPAVETQLFGITGRGSRFVYVFDRSFSMDGAPLAAAKRELLASIARLDRLHQFQIVFYNENPRVMRLQADQPPRMVFADDNGLAAAESFVGSITAAGATDHVQALKMALRMGPDVVFFLTDADEPQLTAAQLETIHRLADGTTINAIRFQFGPGTGAGGFLRKIAEQNGGQYKHVDVTELEK